MRLVFERWARSQSFFGYVPSDTSMFTRDGDGYEDAIVHAAWMAWKAATFIRVATGKKESQ